MAVWVIRAGSKGQDEELALEQNVALVGYSEVPDLSELRTEEELLRVCTMIYGPTRPKAVKPYSGELWSFIHEIKQGDLVVLPLKTKPVVAVGEMTGNYCFRDIGGISRHTRSVVWQVKNVPLELFKEDLQRAFKALWSVYEVRVSPDERIRRIIEGL